MGGKISCGEVLVVSPLLLWKSLTRTVQRQRQRCCLPLAGSTWCQGDFLWCVLMPDAVAGTTNIRPTGADTEQNTSQQLGVLETSQTLQLALQYRGKREEKDTPGGLKLSNNQTTSREFEKFLYFSRFHCISSSYFSHFPGPDQNMWVSSVKTESKLPKTHTAL